IPQVLRMSTYARALKCANARGSFQPLPLIKLGHRTSQARLTRQAVYADNPGRCLILTRNPRCGCVYSTPLVRASTAHSIPEDASPRFDTGLSLGWQACFFSLPCQPG